jgi:hypothetical protein
MAGSRLTRPIWRFCGQACLAGAAEAANHVDKGRHAG